MATRNFPVIMDWLAVYEGGKVDDPDDPGGRTNRGVTQRVYNGYRKRRGLPTQDVYLMTDIEHDEIYAQQYWRPVWGDDLPSGLDAAMFDFAVNSGVSRAVKFLQKIVGVTQDGVMGNVTMGAVRDWIDARSVEELVVELCMDRMAFLKKLRHWWKYKNGWTRRVVGDEPGVQAGDIGVMDRGVMLARGKINPGSIPKPKQAAPGKAEGDPVGAILGVILAIVRALFGGRNAARA